MRRKAEVPRPCDLAEVPVATAPAPHGERPSESANGGREPLDVCVVGQGPTAVSAALSATERGLSVVLLSQLGDADQAMVRPGILGHRHPYGYRWLVRRFGRRAAESYVRGSRSGTDRIERLVRAFQLDCDLGVAPCRLRAFDGGARSLRSIASCRDGPGRSRIWLTRFGGRPSAGDELALWLQRTWGDALIRHRWRVDTPMVGGHPVYGEVRRSGRWLLGGLRPWGLAIQAHAAEQVVEWIRTQRALAGRIRDWVPHVRPIPQNQKAPT